MNVRLKEDGDGEDSVVLVDKEKEEDESDEFSLLLLLFLDILLDDGEFLTIYKREEILKDLLQKKRDRMKFLCNILNILYVLYTIS